MAKKSTGKSGDSATSRKSSAGSSKKKVSSPKAKTSGTAAKTKSSSRAKSSSSGKSEPASAGAKQASRKAANSPKTPKSSPLSGIRRPRSPKPINDKEPKEGVWTLRLYVAGNSVKSMSAMRNLKRLCEEHLDHEYEIEVVDLLEHPQLAAVDQVLAIPTLVRRVPEPVKRVIGDLSNADRASVALDLRSMDDSSDEDEK